jgi:hypothetical protein
VLPSILRLTSPMMRPSRRRCSRKLHRHSRSPRPTRIWRYQQPIRWRSRGSRAEECLSILNLEPLLFHRRPATITPIRAFESSTAAIADQSTRGSECQSISGTDRANRSVWANISGAELSSKSSSMDDRHCHACARTTGAGKGPWTVEISTTAAAAARPRSMRLLGGIWLRAFRPSLPRAR